MRFAEVRDSHQTHKGVKLMSEVSVRVPDNWTTEQITMLKGGMHSSFNCYVIENPLVRGEPVIHFEVFPAERPYTKDGEVRGLTDKGVNEWWDNAILHIMQYLQSQFEGRGVVMYTIQDDKTYHLPMLDDCKAA